jgi:hypothetical protein
MAIAKSSKASKVKKSKSKAAVVKDGRKVCSVCMKDQLLELFGPDPRNSIGLQARCNPCQKEYARKYRESDDGFLLSLFGNSKGSSKKRQTSKRVLGEHTLTLKHIKDKLQEQAGLCAISGQLMTLRAHSDYKASIERLDNSSNYTEINFSLVCLEFNTSNQWTKAKHNYAMSHSDILSDEDITKRLDSIRNSKNVSGGQKGYKAKVQESRTTVDDETEYKCNKCNTYKGRNSFDSKISRGCKPCSSLKAKKRCETWRGAMLTLFNSAVGNSKRRNNVGRADMVVSMTFETIVALYEKQKGRCAYSGIIMTTSGDWKISLERVRPWKGYTEDNVVLVAQEFNSIDNRSGETKQGSNWSRDKYLHFRQQYEQNI